MRILTTLISCSALIAGLSFNTAHAQSSQDGRFAVGLGIGTTGATVEAKFAPNDMVAVRGSFNYLSFDFDEEYDDILYEGEFDATTFGAFVDVAPFKNGFVLSGGAFLGDKTLDINSTPTVNVDIGGRVFRPSEVGTLTGSGELSSFAPYAGLGYDGFIAGSKTWSFNARAGVMFTGSADVDLVSTNGSLSDSDFLRAQLEAEIAEIEDEADDYKYYPVLTLGVARRF